MAYRLSVRRKAGKFIEDQPPQFRKKLWERINALRDDPRPHNCLKLTDFKPDGWRIRVGDYRVLYRIYEDDQLVWIFDVDLRAEDTYRQ